jgi:thioredoxin 1
MGELIMISRRIVLGAVALAPFFSATAVRAAETVAFTQAAFDAAQKAGKSILVDISAPWCPTCRAQAPIIKKLSAQAEFKDLMIFHVDFDSQMDVVKNQGAQQQSTLIVYKGGKETGRSVGDTNADSIGKLLAQAV